MCSHSERQPGGFLKIKYATQQLHSWHSFHGKENLHLHQHLYTNVQSSFIYNRKKLETMQMSFIGGMIKILNQRILPRNKREQHTTTWMNLPHIEWEKTISKSYMVHHSIYITCLRWPNDKNGGKSTGSQESIRGWRGWRQVVWLEQPTWEMFGGWNF